MRVRTPVALLAAAALASSATLSAPALAMAPREFSEPVRIPGTAGLFNPFAATAPDGTDLVTWGRATGTGFENEVLGKVRLPGERRWRSLPVRLHGPFLGVNAFAATPGGDFWVVYSQGSGGTSYRAFVTKLDSSTRHWSKPVRLLRDPDYGSTNPMIALAGDGTVVVAFSAPPATGSNYRVAIATHSPGGSWQRRYLTPTNAFAFQHSLAVNRAGDIVVSWIQGTTLSDYKVRAATKAHTKGAAWKLATLSAPGDSQRARASIGADGTAAVTWSSPSSTSTAVRIATRDTHRRLAPWVGRDVVTGVSVAIDTYITSYRNGAATVVWQQITGGGSVELWARTLVGDSFTSAIQLSPDGENAQFDALAQLPNGRAGLLAQRFTTGGHALGLQYRTLKLGQPGPLSVITGDEDVDGRANGMTLGVDAASQAMVIWNRGTNPDVDFAWSSQSGRPVVMTSSWSGIKRAHAAVVGTARVGKTVRCQSGYWVEAASLHFRWLRNGNPLPQTDDASYQLRRRDRGERISCQVTATNPVGLLLLTSPGRRVG